MSRGAILVLVLAFLALPGPAAAEVIQRDGLRVGFDAQIRPHTLPRRGTAPLQVSLSAKISGVDGAAPPQLRRLEVEINRHGHFDPTALPSCAIERIQPATTEAALAACPNSVVGEGRFASKVLLPQQAPFPSVGKVVAFNGRYHGRPAVLAHVYGTDPLPTSFTLPFTFSPAHGGYGTRLSAAPPEVSSKWGYVKGIQLTLGGGRGARRSYLTGACPAPAGFHAAPFSLARGSFDFEGGAVIRTTITRSCAVR